MDLLSRDPRQLSANQSVHKKQTKLHLNSFMDVVAAISRSLAGFAT